MRLRRFVLVPFLLAGLVLPLAAQSGDEFTVIALPDTQHYAASYPHILRAQTEWIAAQREALNIQFVLGLGDIVDYGSSTTQWQNADAGYDVLDAAGVPYALAMGNHDYDEAKPSLRIGTYYKTWFGPARYAQPHLAASFRGGYPEGTTENFYSVFNVAGVDYLVLVLEFYPRDAALTWAASVLEANRDKKVILLTHSFVYADDSRVAKCDGGTAESFGVGADNDGEEMWHKFAKFHPNIFLVLNGHIKDPDGIGRLAELGVNGNLVNQVLSNYQSEPNGGGGYLRILRFKPAENRIEVTTYSPYYNAYRTDPENQFALEMHNLGASATGSGNVVGRVRANDCSKLSGATVGYSGGSVQTDAQGLFTLPAMPGTQAVSAEAVGYAKKSADVLVNDGYDTQQDFFLVPAAGTGSGSCSTGTTNAAIVICSPTDGSTVTSPVRVQAAASSPKDIARLELWVDGVKTTQVASFQMDVQFTAAAGTHRVVVVAVETDGNYFKATVYVTVGATSANQPPVAKLSVTPSSGTAPLTVVASTAESTDPDGAVASSVIDFGNGITAPGPSASYTYQTAGTYTLTATVYDDKQASSTAAATVTVGPALQIARQVLVTSPANGSTVLSPVRVAATATSTSAVTLMQIYIDGKKAFEVAGSSVDAYLTLARGKRRITVQARDSKGYYKETVNVTVQ